MQFAGLRLTRVHLSKFQGYSLPAGARFLFGQRKIGLSLIVMREVGEANGCGSIDRALAVLSRCDPDHTFERLTEGCV